MFAKIKMLLIISAVGVFSLGCQQKLASTILNSPTPVPPDPSKQVTSITLPYVEKWRWSGTTYDLMTITSKDKIAFASDYWGGEEIIVFDAQTGDIVWKSEPYDSINSLSADNKRIYAGSILYVQAYDIESGQILWSGAKQQGFKRGGFAVYPKGQKLEVYDPHNDRLYFLDAETGKTIDEIQRPLLYFKTDNIDYSGTCGTPKMNCLNAKDVKTGEPLWSHDFGTNGVYRWPIFVEDIMYIDASDIYAFEADTGKIRWQYEMMTVTDPETGGIDHRYNNCGISGIAYGSGLIFVVSSNGSIIGLDHQTGQEVGRIEFTPTPTYYNKEGRFRFNVCHTIAASDKFIAISFTDSQELIVFERQAD